jgi:predicted HAD superfamily hydrolase
MVIPMIKNLDNYDLISFDIFDTLLLRGVSQPSEIFQVVWDKAKTNDINLCDISSHEFMKIRIEMERRARNKSINKEITLEDIYKEFPDILVKNKNDLLELELIAEKEYCYVNFEIYQLIISLKNSGKFIALLSDMYLSSIQIAELLSACGIDLKYIDTVIVSSEEKLTKQSGELYQKLLDKFFQIPRDKVMHMGDNFISDYKQALSNGIHAMHYDVIPERINSIYDYERIRHNTPQKEILSLRKLVAASNLNLANYDPSQKNAFEVGASIIGPFLTSYISWVCDQLGKLKIDRIYPFMREGYLLGELLKRESVDRSMKLKVKPIYISRKVTYLPSIEKVNREEIENMIGARNLTLGEAIDLIGLERVDFTDFQAYLEVKIKDSHKITFGDENLKEAIINEFLKPQNIEKSERYIKEQRFLLNTYLKQEIENLQEIATIDIGFFGRIQMWMEKSLNIEHIPHKMKHYLAIGITGDKLYEGMNMEGYYGTLSENSDLIQVIHRTTDIIEKLISVAEGSTVGYLQEEDRIIPKKSEELRNKEYLDIVFEGILTYQAYWFKFRKLKPNLADMSLKKRREMLMLLHRLIDMPRLEEVSLLKDFEGDTNFGTNYKKSMITEENKVLAEEKGLDFIDKCNVSYTYRDSNIVWPKGLITLYDKFYYVRKVVKNSAGNTTLLAMQEVVEKIKEQGIHEVSLYGAGENGRQFYFVCKLYHIKVNCFIDRKESLWGSNKEGIEIIGLKEAIKRGQEVFLITSLFSINEIEKYISDNFRLVNKVPRIFSI